MMGMGSFGNLWLYFKFQFSYLSLFGQMNGSSLAPNCLAVVRDKVISWLCWQYISTAEKCWIPASNVRVQIIKISSLNDDEGSRTAIVKECVERILLCQ